MVFTYKLLQSIILILHFLCLPALVVHHHVKNGNKIVLQSRSASTLRLFSIVLKVDLGPIWTGAHFSRPQSSFPFLADKPRRLRRRIHAASDPDSRPPKIIKLSSILSKCLRQQARL